MEEEMWRGQLDWIWSAREMAERKYRFLARENWVAVRTDEAMH